MRFDNSKNPQYEPAEATVIERIQRREPNWHDLFGALVKRHQGAVHARCMAYLRNPADADDATQETLFRAFRAIDSFKGDAAFRTWLFAIADNQCHTLAHRRARQVPDDRARALVRLEHESPGESEGTNAGCAEMVRAAMAQVAAKGRDVLQLRYFAELSLEEIAFTLGVGLSAAKMRLYRAQEQLAGVISGYDMDRAA
jgi:RNA polymerase sigma-70 factor (ECF subfamily)